MMPSGKQNVITGTTWAPLIRQTSWDDQIWKGPTAFARRLTLISGAFSFSLPMDLFLSASILGERGNISSALSWPAGLEDSYGSPRTAYRIRVVLG